MQTQQYVHVYVCSNYNYATTLYNTLQGSPNICRQVQIQYIIVCIWLHIMYRQRDNNYNGAYTMDVPIYIQYKETSREFIFITADVCVHSSTSFQQSRPHPQYILLSFQEMMYYCVMLQTSRFLVKSPSNLCWSTQAWGRLCNR